MSGRRKTDDGGSTPGVIEPSTLYHKNEILGRLRWGAHAWRTATRQGLRILRGGNHAYVMGGDVIDYLQRINSTDATRV